MVGDPCGVPYGVPGKVMDMGYLSLGRIGVALPLHSVIPPRRAVRQTPTVQRARHGGLTATCHHQPSNEGARRRRSGRA